MSARCCAATPVWNRRAGQVPMLTGSILVPLLLAVLPKCPFCLAAWLTVATGFSFSAAGCSWMRDGAVVLWIAMAAAFLWRRAIRHLPAKERSLP